MSSLANNLYTPEEYLALERETEYRSEYVNGRIYAMSGTSREHALITLNVGREISAQLDDTPCETYVTDLRVKVSPTGMYTYPDVVVACEEPRFEDKQVDTLLNPTVIVEVLSPSTELYDRTDKFAHYRKLPSLAEYVLVSQDKMRVEQYSRQDSPDEQWMLTIISNNPDDILTLASIGCKVALRSIYRKVKLTDDNTPEQSTSV